MLRKKKKITSLDRETRLVTPIAPLEVTTTTAVTRRRTRTGTHMTIAAQVEQAVDAAEAEATKLEEEEDVVGMTERTATADSITAAAPRSTAGTTALFASRTNRLVKPNMRMLHTLVPQRHLPLTLRARPPRTPI